MSTIRERVGEVLGEVGLWRRALIRGNRNYGLHESPYPGDNIFLLFGDEQAIIISFWNNKAVVRDFFFGEEGESIILIKEKRAGDYIRKLLRDRNLLYVPKEEKTTPVSGYVAKYYWTCEVCGQKGDVPEGLEVEVDNQGEGGPATFKRICESHEEKSPGCDILNSIDNSKFRIFDRNLVEQKEITKLFSRLIA